jgi:hypothetical protein
VRSRSECGGVNGLSVPDRYTAGAPFTRNSDVPGGGVAGSDGADCGGVTARVAALGTESRRWHAPAGACAIVGAPIACVVGDGVELGGVMQAAVMSDTAARMATRIGTRLERSCDKDSAHLTDWI